MNNLKNEILRINTLINNDRVSITDSFTDLFNMDINKVILDYFELSQKPKIIISKEGSELVGRVEFKVSSIKSFRDIK